MTLIRINDRDVARLRCCLVTLLTCTTVHKVCLSCRIIAGSDHTGSAVAKASRVLFAQSSDASRSSGGFFRARVDEPGLKPSFDGCRDVYRVAKSAKSRPYNNRAR